MNRILEWLQSAAAEDLLEWQKREAAAIVGNVFGYHALEVGVGLGELDLLQSSKVLHQVKIDVSEKSIQGAVYGPPDRLPWCDDVFNLVVAHHVLDCYPQSDLLPEIVRSVAPEGVLCLFGLSRFSLTAMEARLRQLFGRDSLPVSGVGSLGASLRAQGVDILMSRFGCHHMLSETEMLRVASRPVGAALAKMTPRLGSAYVVVARKRSLIRPLRLRDRFRGRVQGPALADPAGLGRNGLRKAEG